ncbi:CRISPR-associated helicase Cas3' [Nitratidesulfovibrio sp. SRB-5]|uniref:CRISPR-associated helicase Cas3' n=1 Tax=Nitratidesulfovibrio sp. SRB-5 TaxID=2872636 RepID=UPI0010270175|nr:CRISPR-associated helicase Cas3' [Nitratidesulfovibrio sp. SRB-5]MBZ2173407.1 CRISPR-associated helicase Cas3' [Nitratidesulfovibrio sp. SRB-5]RXF77168.1 CRISPR-associated helicase Cas3' [Desulfovibrio sp. DS-1]
MKYAHTLANRPESDWEPLSRHLEEVADLAAHFASAFGAGEWGLAAGLLHDVGKQSTAFQAYLRASTAGKGPGRGPDHSTAGAQWAHGHYRKGVGRLLAYVLAGHHAGLPDGIESLSPRLKRAVEPWQSPDDDIAARVPDITDLPLAGRPPSLGFQFMLFVRMVFSCLVDADSLCTEAFTTPDRAAWRRGYLPLSELKVRLDRHLDHLAAHAPATPVNSLRAGILAACRDAAPNAPGLFSLTVPTGGGKTLSSLAFALDHAQAHGLRRVIYAIPYTSIIEQTARVFREALNDTDDHAVLEHHSNFVPLRADGTPVPPGRDGQDDDAGEGRRSILAAENWDAPVVVTTNVQFLESLFAARRSPCRKLHNIARSVVILDEAQMLPPEHLLPCLEVLRALVLDYGCSVVLCTATQPALGKREGFDRGLESPHEIAPNPEQLATALRRVEVTDAGTLDDAQLAARLAGQPQVLCVVNTRPHARALYELLAPQGDAVHLSAAMCPAHRTEVLRGVRQRLLQGQPCRVVATQLVEAGVDIDFPVVYRAMAGVDSLAQAAGRCNREGKLERGQVYLFTPQDSPPPFVRQAAQAARTALRRNPDPLALDTVEAYFRELYWQKGDNLDSKKLLPLMRDSAPRLDFPFPEVAHLFRLIPDDTIPLLIPYDDDARALIADLPYTPAPARLLRRAQRYTVGVYPRVLAALVQAGAAHLATEECAVLINKDLYDDRLGLCADNPTFRTPESLLG